MRLRYCLLVMTVAAITTDCRPSDILTVPAPDGVQAKSALQNQTGAEAVFSGAEGQLFNGIGGPFALIQWTGLLTDEFTFSGFNGYWEYANVDARITRGTGGFSEGGDYSFTSLLEVRSSILVALPLLDSYEPASGRSKIGAAYALLGYAELLLAESFCAGIPLDQILSSGGVRYGTPLTTDSLLGVAASHFDSALAEAHGSDSVIALASVGLGRALLDRGQYSAAATAVHSVATSFVYNIDLVPNPSTPPYTVSLYEGGLESSYGRFFNVANHEGTNGLDFVSAHDPRLLLDSSQTTLDGTAQWYLPLKFEVDPSHIALATGIEARLIQAEAALHASQPTTWLATLNTLRNGGCSVSGTDTTCSLGTGQVVSQTVGLPSLVDPGTDSGRVSLQFRERAFWLFGTSTRLGDLRRLIRQYGRDQSTVFPVGPYVNGNNPNLATPIPSYGMDVTLTLPPKVPTSTSATISNPAYKGCLTSSATP